MLTTPMDVLNQFPVRKSKKQKTVFLEAVQSYVNALGYETRIETGRYSARNLVIGDPETANYLITAHYDTCAWLPFPNLSFPCHFLPFLGYQLFIAALILVVAVGFGLLAALITHVAEIGQLVGFAMVWIIQLLMLRGPANLHNANDNTSGVVTLLEILRSLPENQRSKVCFVLFDLEEAGLIGSGSYRKQHKKATNRQLILNLDCVGDGDHILFFPTKKLLKDSDKRKHLYKCCGNFGPKSVTVREKGFAFYPSDQKNFPYGVGICALRSGKFGLYLGKIHTARDNVLEQTNVNILRAALISMISSDAAQ